MCKRTLKRLGLAGAVIATTMALATVHGQASAKEYLPGPKTKNHVTSTAIAEALDAVNPGPSGAPAAPSASEVQAQLAAFKKVLDEQQRQIVAQQRQIEHLQRALSEVQHAQAETPYTQRSAQLPVVYGLPDGSAGSSRMLVKPASARTTLAAASETPPAPRPTSDGRETVGQKPVEEQKPVPDLPALADMGGGVLTPKGHLSLEPSFTASHSSSNTFLFRGVEILPSFLIGAIEVNQSERDYLSGALAVRYGLTNRLETSVTVPYVYRADQVNTNAVSIGGITGRRNTSGSGLGDIEVGLQYQINRGRKDWPIMVGNVRVKAPTGRGPFEVDRDSSGLETEPALGSGFWAIEPSVTFIKTMDPLVFYGNLSYLLNLGKDINQTINISGQSAFIGNVNPGNAFGISFGGAMGLTENVSVSLGYNHNYIMKTRQVQSSIDTTTTPFTIGPPIATESQTAQVGSIVFGVNMRNNSGGSYSLSLSAGVTNQAPDVQISLRRPFGFTPFK